MKIEINESQTYKCIENLKVGQTFIYRDHLCVLIENGCIDREQRSMEMFPYLILDLGENKLNAFHAGVSVLVVDAKIVIK